METRETLDEARELIHERRFRKALGLLKELHSSPSTDANSKSQARVLALTIKQTFGRKNAVCAGSPARAEVRRLTSGNGTRTVEPQVILVPRRSGAVDPMDRENGATRWKDVIAPKWLVIGSARMFERIATTLARVVRPLIDGPGRSVRLAVAGVALAMVMACVTLAMLFGTSAGGQADDEETDEAQTKWVACPGEWVQGYHYRCINGRVMIGPFGNIPILCRICGGRGVVPEAGGDSTGPGPEVPRCRACSATGRCSRCNGSGEGGRCNTCDGRGQVENPYPSLSSAPGHDDGAWLVSCRSCNGTGKERCPACGGSGRCGSCGRSGGASTARTTDAATEALQAQILGNHPATAKFNLQLKQARESGSNTIPCVVCDGQRVFKVATFGGNNVHPCPGCNMNGFRPYFERDAELPQGPVSISCPTCGGSGEFSGVGDFFTMACPSCGGKGQLRVSD